MNNISYEQEIFSARFFLRPLDVQDVSKRYANWLSDESTGRYISARLSINQLRHYVAHRCNRSDVLFLGIFDKTNGLHIGNIKYEPIEIEGRRATMGILIGEKEWQGKSVASEVIIATAKALNERLNIEKIVLGVSMDNLNAIRAYEKTGFKKISIYNKIFQMELDINKELTLRDKR